MTDMPDDPAQDKVPAGFATRLARLQREHEELLGRRNVPASADGPAGNGIFERWRDPVLTRDHVPLEWRYDFHPQRNPFLMERIGVNSTFNAGAMLWRGRYLLVVRVEGNDRKSFFAIAESDSGVEGFRFRPRPVTLPRAGEDTTNPQTNPETNVYDMRLTAHEDGHLYGLFCSERHDPAQPQDPEAAVAACGIVRTTDLVHWERLPNLVTTAGQQRNVVLHPEFVDGRYALYTRPQDGFVEVGGAGGICWGLTASMEAANVAQETLIDPRAYHTISEAKNGQGPPPIRTGRGWLHLAHGVRRTAAGLRYVLYLFLTDLQRPWEVICKPGGHLLAPRGGERVGDVSNVVFSNGWIRNERDEVFIYYASADTRLHVATSTVERLLDYCVNTPRDGLTSAASMGSVERLIRANESLDPEG
jgi:4-O-beta-D-mannosyl-D-glucose phosphorylase